MTNDAIIGHSGFVGGTLAQQHDFAGRFNSKTIDRIKSQPFDTVVCAAAPGSMFTANRDPGRDCAAIKALIDRLDGIEARRFVLISSIAVLSNFAGGDDEDTKVFQTALAYGRHRRLLEAFCEDRFETCLVVRLPALFGLGLRKNFVFDLMNPVPTMLPGGRLEVLLEGLEPDLRDTLAGFYAPDAVTGMLKLDRPALDADPQRSALDLSVRATGMSATQFHHPDTTYQYYDMARLWSDISIATRAGLRCIHLATAPLRAGDIHSRLLGTEMPKTDAKQHREDMRTRHGALWGRNTPYLEDEREVLDKLATFFERQRLRP